MSDELRKQLIGKLPEGLKAKINGQPRPAMAKTDSSPKITGRPTLDAYIIAPKSSLVGVDPDFAILMPPGSTTQDLFLGQGNVPYVWAIGWSARQPERHRVYMVQAGSEIPADCDINDRVGMVYASTPNGVFALMCFKRGEWPEGSTIGKK
jgi:hypothetical protein